MWLEDVYMGLLAKECRLQIKEIGPIHLYAEKWKEEGANPDLLLVHYVKKSAAFIHLYKLIAGTSGRGGAAAATLTLDPPLT